MAIAPQITVTIKPDLYQAVLNTDMLKTGSILRLKVLELRGDRALIDFGNFRTTADVKIPVTLGEELLVRVQESGRQLKLHLLNPEQIKTLTTASLARSEEDSAAEGFKKILSDLKPILNQALAPRNASQMPSPILNLLTALNAHFESFDLKEDVAVIVARLKAYLESSGLFFEKFLESLIVKFSNKAEPGTAEPTTGFPAPEMLAARDLKANLMMLKDFAVEEASLAKALEARAGATLRHAVDALLADIEQQQGRAVKHLDTAEPFQVFNYNLPLKENHQAARLKIYYQKKPKTGKKKGFQISLLLSMDRLGDLRTDFNLVGRDLTVTFFVKDRATKATLQKNYFELQKLLAPCFDQFLLRVMVSKKKIKDFDHEDIRIAGDRRVDLRI
jgi:hypothetical protein